VHALPTTGVPCTRHRAQKGPCNLAAVAGAWADASTFELPVWTPATTGAFTALLWDGVHGYSHVARATTLGTFVVPPPKAEEMYHPETFGRGRRDRVVVE
jgi:alpha-2-macroglobulin